MKNHDTIAAIATAPGVGGVGIIRISGEKSLDICQQLTNKSPKPRQAIFSNFKHKKKLIDEGIIIYFPNPYSFTGEDVIELQAHGGPVILNMLLQAVIKCGARQAQAGEFSQRAFLNDKIDLVQAEAIADLISSSTEQAAMAAQRSLQGDFSKKISAILKQLIALRVWIEAAIDFPEEEIDFLADKLQQRKMQDLHQTIKHLLSQAQQGELLNKGVMIGIVGQPNVGKSSILNLFTRNETAIVSDIAGTTRDIIKENINIQGIPVLIIDTAGIHITEDKVEQEGIKRAKQILQQADIILQIIDSSKNIEQQKSNLADLPFNKRKITIYNKSDISSYNSQLADNELELSAKTGCGFDLLENKIINMISKENNIESSFSARSRHISQLQKTLENISIAEHNFINNQAGELVAEDLRQAQESLSQITGEFNSDDLLGEIFSSFCIGK
ncbi:MAG: tRNA uridine-5-carboxymethylaminomethyl(34) synthesis GTPase MnmE [Alcanivoracaceae bacterium]|nr:tRNA uridine-5-carboxymethylaminomethyl(34) synthesis GTPase MnmE [Alcanivoracaceae bacterium]